MAMRVLLFCNNRAGLVILQWLNMEGANIVGVVLHPQDERSYGEGVVAEANAMRVPILDGSQLRNPSTLQAITELAPDIGISVWFGYILKPPLLELFPMGCVNLHPSFLPWNRGAHPNVWSIIDETPSGVTLHKIDAGIDTGPILCQQSVSLEPTDTAKTLYSKLEDAAIELFQQNWHRIPTLLFNPQTPSSEKGTFHKIKDLEKTEPIDLDQPTTARQLFNLLRARTFPPYKGTYFLENGKKIYVQLDLSLEEDGGD